MAYAQQDNVTVAPADGWKAVTSGGPNVMIQLLSSTGVILSIGTAPPSPGTSSGFQLSARAGRDTFSAGGLTGETIYGRAASATAGPAVLAVAAG